MAAKRDYYEILGVAKNASDAEIKKSYRRLAMKYHPDRNPDDKSAEEKFKEAKEAYEVLSDNQKRAAYDQFGHAGVEAAGRREGVTTMAQSIRAVPTSHGTTDWRVTFDDDRYICDLHLVVSSMLNGSRYYVLDEEGGVVKEGTFDFGMWDWDTIRETVAAIVRSMYADAEVAVELPAPPQRRAQ